MKSKKFEDMINTIQLGDCYELIKNIPDNSIDLDGKFIDCMYMSEAIKIDKVHYASLIKCCKGIYKTCGGYIWRYSNE